MLTGNNLPGMIGYVVFKNYNHNYAVSVINVVIDVLGIMFLFFCSIKTINKI